MTSLTKAITLDLESSQSEIKPPEIPLHQISSECFLFFLFFTSLSGGSAFQTCMMTCVYLPAFDMSAEAFLTGESRQLLEMR